MGHIVHMDLNPPPTLSLKCNFFIFLLKYVYLFHYSIFLVWEIEALFEEII